MIRRGLIVVAFAWCLVSAVLFVLAALVPAWPTRLELPWSNFEDFVVTPGGKVVVYTAYFQQLLVYDLEGRFLASLAGPRARGDHKLATDVESRVYIRRGTRVYVAPTLSPFIFTLEVHADPASQDRGWWLTEDGVPCAIPDGVSVSAPPDRPILKGEVLFANGMEKRRRFDVSSGVWVERTGDSLVVYDATGAVKTLTTAWYLYWLKFPIPGALPWIIALVLGIGESRLRPWFEGREKYARAEPEVPSAK